MKILLPLFILLTVFSCTHEPVKKVELKKEIKEGEQLTLYTPPDTSTLDNDDWGNAVKYGLLLVKNTAFYIGPNGIVSKNLRNKMNCTNCHLDNGTRPFGLNFFDSHRTYPQYRAREDKILTMEQRVNNCIERPHRGIPLSLNSKEMVAIVSYIKWIGENYNPKKMRDMV